MKAFLQRLFFLFWISLFFLFFGILALLISSCNLILVLCLPLLLFLIYRIWVIGYTQCDFAEHENWLETDISLDFAERKNYDKWNSLQKIFDEVGEQKLTDEQVTKIREIISEMAAKIIKEDEKL